MPQISFLKIGSLKILSKSLSFGVATVGILLLSACASTGTIVPQYVPLNTYQQLNCAQLSQEYKRLLSHIDSTQKQQTPLTTSGIGIGISGNRHGIYPTINFGLGHQISDAIHARQNKLARLFGEHDAIIQAGRMKQCGFVNGIKIYGE